MKRSGKGKYSLPFHRLARKGEQKKEVTIPKLT
jgi:hypothetical protein